jgi:hypothetical protein
MAAPGDESFGGYTYLGRGLGEHFEVGILPYGYISNDESWVGALFVPLKFNPFPYDFRAQLTLFAGPVLYAVTGFNARTWLEWPEWPALWGALGLTANMGLGFSANIDIGEVYWSVSTALHPSAETTQELISLGLNYETGFRLLTTERLLVGMGAMMGGPGIMGGMFCGFTVTHVLGKQ